MGTDDLLNLAVSLTERAANDEAVEAFVTHGKDFSVKAYEGEVEQLSSSEPRGAGVRVITEGRAGFAYTTDLSDQGLEILLALARDNAQHATPDDAVALAEPWTERPADISGLVDERQEAVSPESRVRFAIDLERATRAVDRKVRAVEEAVYSDSDTRIAIANSTGVSGMYRRTDAWCYSVAIATDGDDTEVGFEFDLGRGIGALDADRVAQRAAERALGVLGADKIPSARMPVVFDPYTAAQFVGVIAQALTGEAVQKGRSLFAGRMGDRVAGSSLTLVDDGRLEGAPGSAPWDAEGVPTQRTPVISGGVLSSFLYDVTSGRREGRNSTGNASRAGFKSPPHPSPSNLAFEPTGQTREEVMRKAGRALLVQDFHGVHSGANPISGDFSVGATGRLLEGGEPAEPVKEITIAAPMMEVLNAIEAVADDRRWLPFGGSYGGATTLVAEMTIGGR
jgi:PmbA protein